MRNSQSKLVSTRGQAYQSFPSSKDSLLLVIRFLFINVFFLNEDFHSITEKHFFLSNSLTWLDLTWLDLTWLDLTWLDLTWLKSGKWQTQKKKHFSHATKKARVFVSLLEEWHSFPKWSTWDCVRMILENIRQGCLKISCLKPVVLSHFSEVSYLKFLVLSLLS
jgi:hypothetical protein